MNRQIILQMLAEAVCDTVNTRPETLYIQRDDVPEFVTQREMTSAQVFLCKVGASKMIVNTKAQC